MRIRFLEIAEIELDEAIQYYNYETDERIRNDGLTSDLALSPAIPSRAKGSPWWNLGNVPMCRRVNFTAGAAGGRRGPGRRGRRR